MVRRVSRPDADLSIERALWGAGGTVAGMDEVGRGALAGPVTVAVTVVSPECGPVPAGLTDSKLLSPAARERLRPVLRSWCLGFAVAHSPASLVDQVGIVAALRAAGQRALAAVEDVTGPVGCVLLDGSHDWLSAEDPALFELDGTGGPPVADAGAGQVPRPARQVVTKVKADQSCASVAAASVLAKCDRDAIMVDLASAYPDYGWASNKGYGSAAHLAALRRLGPTDLHRKTWALPVRS